MIGICRVFIIGSVIFVMTKNVLTLLKLGKYKNVLGSNKPKIHNFKAYISRPGSIDCLNKKIDWA